MGHKNSFDYRAREENKQAITVTHKYMCTTTIQQDHTPRFRTNSLHQHTASCTLITTRLVACVAVAESIPVISLLVIDIGRRAIALSLRVVHGLVRSDLVRLLDGVAPVGRNQSLVGVDDAERRCEAANHSAGSIWSTGFLVDELHENVIIWGRLRKLQDDLVCPLPYVAGENLVSGGILPVSHN